MTIKEIVSDTPIPKNKQLLDSVEFLQILAVKSVKLHNLILKDDKVKDVLALLSDFEMAEALMSNTDNLSFLRFLMGTKYIELGLRHDKDEYLVKGILKFDLLDEGSLREVKLASDYYRLYSRAILVNFNNQLEQNQNFQYSYAGIEPLLKAKYLLFRLYSLLIEKKIKLKEEVESKVISDLVSVLIFLSRWNEPFFILSRRTVISEYKPAFISYLKSHTLNEIAHFTCCSIFPAMTYEIKKFIKMAETQKGRAIEWKKRLTEIKNETDSIIEKNEFDLSEFEKQDADLVTRLNEHTDYRKWVLENHFALCEHAMYCFCSVSNADDLTIKSNHNHTQIEWVGKFEVLLDKLKADYNLSRYFLYLSENESKLNYVRNDEITKTSGEKGIVSDSNSDFLIQAFKSSYSILDKIGRAIYIALEIEQKDVYFHNCWKKIKESKGGHQNRYLFTLYSMACDLSETSKYSAFKEYKKWRNLIEHEFFFLVGDRTDPLAKNSNLSMLKEVVEISEFKEKTYYMLQLCRSAIFSFTFFIRHESKRKEGLENNIAC